MKKNRKKFFTAEEIKIMALKEKNCQNRQIPVVMNLL